MIREQRPVERLIDNSTRRGSGSLVMRNEAEDAGDTDVAADVAADNDVEVFAVAAGDSADVIDMA